MKTLLIPVDFTHTSDNTAKFAIQWSCEYGYDHIILLKTLYNSIFDGIAQSEGCAGIVEEYEENDSGTAAYKIRELSNILRGMAPPGVMISTALTELPLLRAMLKIIRSENPSLVAIGSDNDNYWGNSFIAASVISIAKVSPTRVLIVPSGYPYKAVQSILVPIDLDSFDHLDNLVKTYRTDKINWHHKKLHVLGIDHGKKQSWTEERLKKAEAKLKELLKEFSVDIHYSTDAGIIGGIAEFIRRHEVELIVALPGKRSFLYSLTQKNIEEALYKNSSKPVLILK